MPSQIRGVGLFKVVNQIHAVGKEIIMSQRKLWKKVRCRHRNASTRVRFRGATANLYQATEHDTKVKRNAEEGVLRLRSARRLSSAVRSGRLARVRWLAPDACASR